MKICFDKSVHYRDKVVATVILDRLLHHSHIINIQGDNYRLREKGILHSDLYKFGAKSRGGLSFNL